MDVFSIIFTSFMILLFAYAAIVVIAWLVITVWLLWERRR